MSSIFDNLNNSSENFDVFGRDKMTGHNIKTVAYEETAERLAKKEELDNIRNSFAQMAEKEKLVPKTPIFNDLVVESNYVTTGSDKTHYTRSEIIRMIGDAKKKYTELTIESLVMNSISSIIFEACPIDEDLKKRDDIRRYFYGFTVEMYNDMKKVDPDLKPVSFINDIRDLATDLVTAEANLRFDYTRLDEHMSFEKATIDKWINAQLNNTKLNNEYFEKIFNTESAQIIIENGEAIKAIKDKVTADLDDYKNSVDKLNGITDAVKPASEELKDATGEDEPKENEVSDGSTADTTNSDNTGDDNADNSSDNNNSDSDNDSADSGTADDNKDNSTGDSGKATEDTEGTKPNGSDNDGTEQGNGGKAEEGEDLIGTGANVDKNVKNVAADSKISASSQKVAEEIEDATEFANNYTHTFNTGDEKFEEIRLNLYKRLSAASASRNVEELNAIRNDSMLAAKNIQTISDNNNEKYADMAHKFEELVKAANFEVNKAISATESAVKNSRTVLESFIVGIGKRYYKKIADAEKYNVKTESAKIIEQIPGDKVIAEALVYNTVLEAFNTLRIMDLRKPKVLAEFKSFVNEIKNK